LAAGSDRSARGNPPQAPPGATAGPRLGAENASREAALGDLLSLSQTQIQIEESRAQGLHARGVGLGGFASVVMSLLALAVSSGLRPGAASIPGAARCMLIAALVILAVAVSLIVEVIRPRALKDIRADELDRWRNGDASRVRVEALARLSEAIANARPRNHRKAILLHWSGVLVVVAVWLSAAAATVIALES
jgi:hypothetical protein